MTFAKAYGYLRGQIARYEADSAYGISLGEMAILANQL